MPNLTSLALKQWQENCFYTMPCTLCNPEDSVTHSPDKISKIPSVYFVASRCGVCVSNLSSLALNCERR